MKKGKIDGDAALEGRGQGKTRERERERVLPGQAPIKASTAEARSGLTDTYRYCCCSKKQSTCCWLDFNF